jgi:Retrotransposon gag protein
VKNFDLFKAEMLANFVDMSVEDTVRFRLAQLKQVNTVTHYYSQFRAIAVEADTYTVIGPEACAAFSGRA